MPSAGSGTMRTSTSLLSHAASCSAEGNTRGRRGRRRCGPRGPRRARGAAGGRWHRSGLQIMGDRDESIQHPSTVYPRCPQRAERLPRPLTFASLSRGNGIVAAQLVRWHIGAQACRPFRTGRSSKEVPALTRAGALRLLGGSGRPSIPHARRCSNEARRSCLLAAGSRALHSPDESDTCATSILLLDAPPAALRGRRSGDCPVCSGDSGYRLRRPGHDLERPSQYRRMGRAAPQLDQRVGDVLRGRQLLP